MQSHRPQSRSTPPSQRKIASMIRVDQAGEFGATRIYAGQRAVMGDRAPGSAAIAGMAAQEEEHLAWFNGEMARRGVRPTALQPIWHVAGFALGAVTAAMGPEAAMACTAAVETEIDKHYRDQLDELGECEPELSAKIAQFREEEIEHLDHALAAGAERAPAYPILSGLIRLGCRAAIEISKRV